MVRKRAHTEIQDYESLQQAVQGLGHCCLALPIALGSSSGSTFSVSRILIEFTRIYAMS